MSSSFFYYTFIFILISVLFITFCFSSVIITLSHSNNEISFLDGSLILPKQFFSSNSKFLWPTPRSFYHNIVFWLSNSTHTRSFYISLWYWHCSPIWNRHCCNFFWYSYIYWFLRSWWLYSNCSIWKFFYFLLSYFAIIFSM